MANFTSIATGAAANASIVNAPLGQLDAAIGALSSLGTANKTSVVAGVNEVLVTAYTNIGTLAGLSTTTKTSLVAAINELYAVALSGGANVSDTQLKAWAESESYEATAITMSGTYPLVVQSATVKWPDGSAGLFTATIISATWQGVDAYTVTHTASGKTVTQAAVTRNINGSITTKPALVVS